MAKAIDLAESVNPNDLIDIQRRHVAQAQNSLARRQRRIVERALNDFNRSLGKVAAGSWTEAEMLATRAMLGQAMREMVGKQTGDLDEALVEVMRMSSKGAAKYLATMDAKYLGVVRPMRFDSLEWFERTHPKIGQARLRQYKKSFQRYGAGNVAKIEDALARRILVGESWDKARQEVWDTTREVVGDRRWMVDRIVRTEVAATYNGMTLQSLIEEDTDDEPMLKKLMATFDAVTGHDSARVHGQTRALDKPFNDGRIDYMAPPNRPHDREIVVGWRKSWGDDEAMADFDQATAKPRDGDAMAPKPDLEPVKPPAPTVEPIPLRPAAASIDSQIAGVRARKAALGVEISGVVQSRIPTVPGAHYPPEQAAQISVHNDQVGARLDALRRDLRELQARQLNLEMRARNLKKQKEKQAKAKAVGADPPALRPVRLQAPTPISKVKGPGKAPPPPKPKATDTTIGKAEKGDWLDFNGGVAEVVKVDTRGGFTFTTLKLPGREVTLPLPEGTKARIWNKRPPRSAGPLADADNLSALAADGDKWLFDAIRENPGWEKATTKVFDDLGKFNREVFAEMVDILEAIPDKGLVASSVELSGPQKLAGKLSGKGSESAKLKRYVVERELAEASKMSGLERGMATEYVAEFEAMRDKLRFAPRTISDLSVRSKKSDSANAWVSHMKSMRTEEVRDIKMVVNSAHYGTREEVRHQMLRSKLAVKEGHRPWSASGHFDEGEKFLQTIRHEYGHIVDASLQQRWGERGPDAILSKAILKVWRERVSKLVPMEMQEMSRYANTMPMLEGLAEAFSLAVSGHWDKIPKGLHRPMRLMVQKR